MMLRLGIFGGSFDPVHYGHLLLAESCREQAQLDQVLFMPTHIQPHKLQHQPAPDAARLDLLRLATAGHPAFAVSTLEIDRGGVSYTVDTLAQLHEQQPGATLFFLLGADSLADFPNWREPARILQLATLLVVRRAGLPEPDWRPLAPFASPERLAEMQAQQVEMPLLGYSASEIRQRVRQGQSIRFRMPRAAEEYLWSHELYRTASRTA